MVCKIDYHLPNGELLTHGAAVLNIDYGTADARWCGEDGIFVIFTNTLLPLLSSQKQKATLNCFKAAFVETERFELSSRQGTQ